MALHSNKAWLYSSKTLGDSTADRHALKRKQKLKSSQRFWISANISKAYLKLALAVSFSIVIVVATQKCAAEELPCVPAPHIMSSLSDEQKVIAALGEPVSPSSNTSPEPAYAGIYRTATPVSKPKIADSKFFVMNGLHFGLAVIDVELTQHCIATHQCREGNPLMPSSHAGQLSIGIGYVAIGSFASYRLKKHKSPYWWLPPAGGIAGHTAGIVTGLGHE